MFGWSGYALEIDLSDGNVKRKKIDKEILENYIGGRGLGVKIYYDLVNPDIEPMTEENLIIFAVGPLTGIAPMSGRHVVVSKSPLTKTVFDSNAGGFFGKELHYAGYDALIIKGKSNEPVVIKIKDDNIKIEKTTLWGKNVEETTRRLERYGSVSCIGRAGERKIIYANIMNDYTHTAGRGGLGAIMGSKNLKAIVVKGTKKPRIGNLEKYKEGLKEMLRLLEASPPLNKGLKVFGTSMLFDIVNYLEVMPTDNFNSSHFENGEKLSGDYILENYEIKNEGCWGCPIRCKKRDKKKNVELPEYETIWAFGPNIGNDDYEKIIEANKKCNDYGMDTITAGATIALWKELQGEDYTDKIEEIGEGKSELKLGSRRIAEKYKARDKSMDIKSLELPGYDPRGLYGQALSYATSNRGGCHLRAYMVAPEIIGKPKLIHRLEPEGKPGLVVIFQNLSAAVDSLILCKFTTFAMNEVEYSKLLSGVTGINYRSEDILREGDRIYNLERLFNIRAGFSGEDDYLPEKIFKGKNAMDREIFNDMLQEYYEFRGWENGIPSEEKLKSLGIK